MANSEPERYWEYEEFKTNYTKLLKGKTVNLKGFFTHINFGVEKELIKLNPDIVIASGSYTYPAIWAAIKYKNKLNYKLLFWSESHLNEQRNYSYLKLLFREMLRKKIFSSFDGFWYAGKLSKEFIGNYSVEIQNMFFAPNLVDNELYAKSNEFSYEKRANLRKKYQISDDKFVFLCPARLAPVKGLDKFIGVYRKSEGREKSVILIAGDGEQKEALESLINFYEIDVRLIGYKGQKEMVDLYSVSDCFLLPSISDPNPLTSIEAIWSGKPLFVSEHVGNHPELVKHSINGYVFNYSDEESTLKYIETIINSSKEWRINAQAVSYEIAKEKYDLEKAVYNLVEEMLSM